MKIADLLIRTTVEIESISKELYFREGGTKPDDKDLYFDTDCLALLESKWSLSKKVVMVSSPILYLEGNDNIYLTPLHKAYKRGTSSSDWQKAYQAVKHNRAKSLKKGNLKHFIRSLGALFILNIYYQNLSFNLGSNSNGNLFDASIGSSIFSIKLYPFPGIDASGIYKKNEDFEKCIYIFKQQNETKELARKAISTLFLSMLCLVAFAQGRQVNGTVKDAAGEPMIGVNVLVKGTTNGTITDFDGNFSLSGVKDNDVLSVTYIGYITQEVKVGNQKTINVVLKEDTELWTKLWLLVTVL